MFFRLFAFLLFAFFAAVAYAAPKPVAPAGVDSLTKLQSDSLAKSLFGTKKEEQSAQKQFENGQEDFRAGEAFLQEADSLRRFGIDTTMQKPTGIIGQLRQTFGDTSRSSYEQQTRKRADAAFRRAAKEFERALEISPTLSEAQLWLVATYDRLQEWDKSVVLYREILNERQGEDRLWFQFGYAALQAGQFDKAINAFEQATHISVLVNNEDSTKIPVRYLTYAGEAYLRTYQDRLALDRFRHALALADSNDGRSIQRTIDWILWDNGGIATAEYRDAAYRAESEQRWDDARQAYLGGIKNARTDGARDELSYHLALLEFVHGTRTDGITRMKDLMERLTDPSPDYREHYGKMLYAYAQVLEKDGDKRAALSYYLQSTKLVWSGQGGGYVEIARIAANDLDTAIKQAEIALTYPLTDDQKQAAYRILESAYRSKGNWDMMKKYRALMESKP